MAALKAGKEGLGVSKKVPWEQDPKKYLVANLLGAVAQAQAALHKYKDALKNANEAMRLAKESQDRRAECNAMMLLAQVHFWNNRREEARLHVTKGLALAQKIKDRWLEHMGHGLLKDIEDEEAIQASGSRPVPTGQEEPLGALETVAESDSEAEPGVLGPYSGPSAESLIPKINEIAMALMTSDEIHQDTPLMDSGLDSLSMVQFRNTLQSSFPGVPMPASLLFDHPSVRAVAENIVEELKAAHDKGDPLV